MRALPMVFPRAVVHDSLENLLDSRIVPGAYSLVCSVRE